MTPDILSVAFNAEPFHGLSNGLKFRTVVDSLAQKHVEASECCLIHYDNPLTAEKGNWINPSVRVGYSRPAYREVAASEVYTTSDGWPTRQEWVWGSLSVSFLHWWKRDPFSASKVRSRIRRWQAAYPDTSDSGLACLEDIAMVLTEQGWALRGARFE